jgi:hypothetical protein
VTLTTIGQIRQLEQRATRLEKEASECGARGFVEARDALRAEAAELRTAAAKLRASIKPKGGAK